MKIVYLPKLKKTAKSLGNFLKLEVVTFSEDLIFGDKTILCLGRGISNSLVRKVEKYQKIWEIGSKADSFDYLAKVIFNRGTVETQKRRNKPEKIVFQRDDFDCGWGIVCTLLLMLQREEVLKTDLYLRLDVNPVDGTKSEKVKKLFDEENIPYIEFWKADLTDLEKVVSVGGVCLVSYQAWGEPEEVERLECGHYSIVFDIDDEFVWLIDPSYDDEEYMPGLGIGVVKRPRAEFEKLWIDKGSDGTVYEKWMMAVRV